MRFRSFSRKRNINTLVAVTVTVIPTSQIVQLVRRDSHAASVASGCCSVTRRDEVSSTTTVRPHTTRRTQLRLRRTALTMSTKRPHGASRRPGLADHTGRPHSCQQHLRPTDRAVAARLPRHPSEGPPARRAARLLTHTIDRTSRRPYDDRAHYSSPPLTVSQHSPSLLTPLPFTSVPASARPLCSADSTPRGRFSHS